MKIVIDKKMMTLTPYRLVLFLTGTSTEQTTMGKYTLLDESMQ